MDKLPPDRGTANFVGLRLALPEVPEAPSMPLHDRVRLHEVQAITPLIECAPQENPEDPITVFDLCSLDAALHHGEPVTEAEVLDDQALAGTQ
jgi:hypothetical protein